MTLPFSNCWALDENARHNAPIDIKAFLKEAIIG